MNKFLIVCAMLLLTFEASAYVDINCTFKYRLAERIDIRICSHERLNRGEIAFIKETALSTPSAYAEFVQHNVQSGQRYNPSIDRIDLVLMTREAMNDGSLPLGFRRNKDVIGRYYPGDSRLYVVLDTIRAQNTVLAHEIVHLLNHHYGITDRELDENLAYAFEDFLASQ
jgi:hypothetical protein